ncbi:hypothetical protein V2J09_010010 [Rumex salicifolius]
MEHLSNKFALLDLDVADDELPPPPSTARKGENGGSSSSARKNKRRGSIEVVKENGNHESVQLKLPFVWIDIQIAGMNVESDLIFEIACVISDGNLNKSVEGPNLVVCQPQECLDKMDELWQDHIGVSGLRKEVLQSTITAKEAEKKVISFVKRHTEGSHKPLLAGDLVYVDFFFLKKYMPNLASLFSHVVMDVSSIRSTCYRWNRKAFDEAPAREQKCRAMDDIRQSIEELKYYKETIFKAKLKK